MFLAPDGKITHYMYGADFLPADVKLSLLSAGRYRCADDRPDPALLLQDRSGQPPLGLRDFASGRDLDSSAGLVFVAFLFFSGRRRQRAAARKDEPESPTRLPWTNASHQRPEICHDVRGEGIGVEHRAQLPLGVDYPEGAVWLTSYPPANP